MESVLGQNRSIRCPINILNRYIILRQHPVHVSMEGDSNDHRNMLEEIQIDNNRVRIHATYARYEVDISDTEKSEYDQMMKILNQLNFDSCFKVVLT